MMFNNYTVPLPRPIRTCSIVLLGETGAGKSSVVNALGLMSKQITMCNLPCVTEQHTSGDVDDDDWGESPANKDIIIDREHEQRVYTFLQGAFSNCVIPSTLTRDLNLFDEREHNESLITGASQTLKPKIFQFDYQRKNFDFRLKVIDTPGMGDTRGNNQDEQNIDMILEHLCTVDDLGGIVLVLNGTVSRVNASVVNVINKLKSILPVDIFKTCFYVLFTNTNSCGSNYNTDWLFPELQQKPKLATFHINNNLFSLTLDQWKCVNTVEKARLVDNWASTQATLKQLLVAVNSNTDTLTPAYKEMRRAHTEFLEKFAIAQSSIRNILEKCRAISILVTTMRNTENSIGSDVQQELKNKTVQVVKFTTAQYFSTYCVDHVLSGLICHECCGLKEVQFSGDPDSWTGDHTFKSCTAFSNERVCQSCPLSSKCDASLHFHSYELPTKVDVPVINMQDSIFREYLGVWKERDTFDNYKNALIRMRDELLDQINDLFAKALQLKQKVYYFDFKKYIQSALDVIRLELAATSLGDGDHDRLIQVCEVYKVLLTNIDQNDLANITSLNIPLIDSILKLDKKNFMNEKLVQQLEELDQTSKTYDVANGIDVASIPTSFVKLYDKFLQKTRTEPTPKESDAEESDAEESDAEESDLKEFFSRLFFQSN